MTDLNLPAKDVPAEPVEITCSGGMKLNFGQIFSRLLPPVEAAIEEVQPADGE